MIQAAITTFNLNSHSEKRDFQALFLYNGHNSNTKQENKSNLRGIQDGNSRIYILKNWGKTGVINQNLIGAAHLNDV